MADIGPGVVGAGVGVKAAGEGLRRYVEDRRGDIEFKQQEEAGELGLKSARRGERKANLDEEYSMFKQRLGEGMQQFAMDPRNYQKAVDTINEQYGSDYSVTHRESPNGEVDFTLNFTGPDGQPSSQVVDQDELGAYMQMSQNPVAWYDFKTKSEQAATAAETEQGYDIEQIDRKGWWDEKIARIKAAASGTGTGTDLKVDKELAKLSNTAFGQLREDGLISFGEGYDDIYASQTAAYASQLARHPSYNTNKAHAYALRSMRDEIKRWEADPATDGMEDEERDLWVSEKVAEVFAMKAKDLEDRAGGGEDASAVDKVKANPQKYIDRLKEAGKSDDEIKQWFEQNGIQYPEAGLQPQGAEMPAPEPEPAAQTAVTEEGGEQMQTAAAEPAADVFGGEGDVEFGSAEAVAKRGKKRGPRGGGERNERLAKGIESAREGAPAGVPGAGNKLPQLRDEAAKRVIAAAAGKGKIKKRVILEAALRSGKLPDDLRKQVEDVLRGKSGTTLASAVDIDRTRPPIDMPPPEPANPTRVV